MNFSLKSVVSCVAFATAYLLSFTAFAQEVSVPQNAEGRWTNKVTGNSNSFSIKEIKTEGEAFEAVFTLWASNGCSVRGQKVKGVIQSGVATFSMDTASGCSSGYVATFDFAKKSGTYKTVDYHGVYEFK